MRVQRGLDVVMHCEHALAELGAGARKLQETDPVLARDGAAELQGVRENLLERQLCAGPGLLVGRRGDQQGVQVAVARVGDVGDHDVGFGGDRLDPSQHFGHGSARYADVFRQYRPESLEGRIGESARLEQRLDALCVSGLTAGAETDTQILTTVKNAVPDTVLFCNTGCRLENIDRQLSVADGAVVGSTFKIDGKFENLVDPARVKAFMDKVKSLR